MPLDLFTWRPRLRAHARCASADSAFPQRPRPLTSSMASERHFVQALNEEHWHLTYIMPEYSRGSFFDPLQKKGSRFPFFSRFLSANSLCSASCRWLFLVWNPYLPNQTVVLEDGSQAALCPCPQLYLSLCWALSERALLNNDILTWFVDHTLSELG